MSASLLDRIGNTPLVALSRLAPATASQTSPRLFGKCEHLNPSGSVKDRTALAIVDDAERRGVLRPGDTLIEATAGNTGMGLALVAAVRGYRLAVVMPEKMSIDKREALALVGAEVIVTPNAPPDDERNFQNVARRLATERGWFLTDQFENAANPAVHERTTGPEILAQTEGRIGAFVCAAGTGGTITGVARFLKSRLPSVRIVLADPVGSVLASWVEHGTLEGDGPYLVEGIGSSRPPRNFDRTIVDAVERVTDEESFAVTRRLIREEGLLVGGSSGTAVAAALRVLERGDVEGPIVAMLPDSWDRYRSLRWLR